MYQTVRCAASPSLALVKYWGKQEGAANIPATTSVALTLSHLETVSQIRVVNSAEQQCITVNGAEQERTRYADFFAEVRSMVKQDVWFEVESMNSFPTGAGLASSSSAFAALAFGCTRAVGARFDSRQLSCLARVGSGSAARAVFGGFTRFSAGALHAEQIAGQDHWSELRVVIAVVDSGAKAIPSREAMNRSRDSSVFYRSWLESSEALAARAESAILDRNLDELGAAMRQSYLRMFATMFTAEPPVIYWLPETIAIIRACERLRGSGVPAWETMDAGPQVKVLTTARHASTVCDLLSRENRNGELLVVGAGAAPRTVGNRTTA